MYIFEPPTVAEAQHDTGPLLSRYRIPRGISVLLLDGLYVQRRFPSLDEIRASQQHYLGGHRYLVDSTVYAALLAAGYGANLRLLPDPYINVYLEAYV